MVSVYLYCLQGDCNVFKVRNLHCDVYSRNYMVACAAQFIRDHAEIRESTDRRE